MKGCIGIIAILVSFFILIPVGIFVLVYDGFITGAVFLFFAAALIVLGIAGIIKEWKAYQASPDDDPHDLED